MNKYKEKPSKKKDALPAKKEAFLVLHNDDVNTFEYVVDSLVEICEHDSIQAEQCAFLAHFTGKCEIKKGNLPMLLPMKDLLSAKGLTTEIEL